MEDTPIFHLPCFLDPVTKGNWDVAVVEDKEGKIIASMPYYLEAKYGYKNIVQPHISQFLGPWFDKDYIKIKTQNRIHSLLDQLKAQLPKFDSYNQNWHHSIQNWLPYYWDGYQQTTRYTYVIDTKMSRDDLWSQISAGTRRNIKKAEKEIEVVEGTQADFDIFFEITQGTFKRKNEPLVYKKEIFEALDKSLRNEGRCKLLFAKHKDGEYISTVYLVWDNQTLYFLAGGIKEAYKKLNPNTILHWESILFAKQMNKIFDFEGSMIPSINNYIRRFNALPQPYYAISKTASKKVLFKNGIKSIISLLKS